VNWRGIRNNIAKLIQAPSYYPAQPKVVPSLSLQALKQQMSMPISELSPGMSQPVWGPELSTVGAYSREGYTSKTFDTPAIPFSTQALPLQIDEDVQLVINRLSSQVTGGEHYIKTVSQELTEYLEDFSHDIEFDTFDTILVKEMLWYGNSIWKPRMGIANVRSFDDLMHIPISSFVRIWWDRQRQPYKYEFRGAEYQGYHNPDEIIHFKWNPVDASAFGTGFGVSATTERVFDMIVSGDESQPVTLPSMLNRKYAIEFIMQMASQRYVTRNVYVAPGATEDERNQLQSFVEQLQIGQDLVAGTNLDVKELGTNTRTFNPKEFIETVSSPIMKALNDFSGKQGSESSHTFANAETAKEESESGLSAFTINVKTQIAKKLFQPWYESNPFLGEMYLDGLIPVDWKEVKFDLNFGTVEKKDIPIEQRIKLMEMYFALPIPKNPKTIMKMFEQAGLPINDDDFEMVDQQMNDPSGSAALGNVDENPDENLPQSDIGGGEIEPQFNNQKMGSPPMDDEIYNDMMTDVRGDGMVPSDYHQSDVSQDFGIGRNYETKGKKK